MKVSTLLSIAALCVAVDCCPQESRVQLSDVLGIEPRDLFESFEPIVTLEFGPDDIRNVTESEKLELLKRHIKFFDITEHLHVASTFRKRDDVSVAAVAYPTAMVQTSKVVSLNAGISKANMRNTLTKFSSFFTRYYKTTHGQQSSAWLQGQVASIVNSSGSSVASVRAFPHSWTQSSIIASIPGKSNKTIIVGAHQDSINLANPETGKAPGADDNGSGCMTILEALRVLLSDATVRDGGAANTIEFHWFAGEEAGLLGSQAIFNNYKATGRNVIAMLNEDMAGYTGAYTKSGRPRKIGFITDFVSTTLTEFTKKVVLAYSSIGFVDETCGYACSDHGSATRVGFPSAMITEGIIKDMNRQLHTANDTLAYVNYDHMLDIAKVTIGWVYELAFAETL